MTYLHALTKDTSTSADDWVSQYKWLTPDFTSGDYLYQMFTVAQGTLQKNMQVKVLSSQGWSFKCYDSSGDYQALRYGASGYYKYYVAKRGFNDVTEVTANSQGMLVMPFNVEYLCVACAVSGQGDLSSYGQVTVTRRGSTQIYIDVYEENLQQMIDDQTAELKDTSGSNTIVGDVTSIGEDIVEGADFVQQTASFVSNSFDAVLDAEPNAGVTFPGLTIMGHTIIQQQTVSVTGYLGSEIEDTIKTGCTLVLFLAWIMGLRGFYHKIFLGEREVEVVEE